MRYRRLRLSTQIQASANMSHLVAPATPPPPSRPASVVAESEDTHHRPARPERAHLGLPSDAFTSDKRLESDLSKAMASPLFAIEGFKLDGLVRAALPRAKPPKADFASRDVDLSRPVSLIHAPKRRRPGQSVQRPRSLSTSSSSKVDADPFAWLRQTVQEQREHPSNAGILAPSSPSSVPASPTNSNTSTGTSISSDIRPDFFGASLLSLIAGREPVQKRVQQQVRRSSVIESPSRLNSPRSPTKSPNMSNWQTPSMPDWKVPAMPHFTTPTLPDFKAPTMPSTSSWMPEAFSKKIGVNAGEEESRKYMDEADQTESSEPDWCRIKVICPTCCSLYLR